MTPTSAGGATAAVFEAEDTQEGGKVALKVMKSELSDYRPSAHMTEAELLKFSRCELIAGDLLEHRNIVRLLGSFPVEPGSDRVVTVWELVEGKDLLELLNECPGCRMTEPRLKHYFLQLLDAVAFMHASGICHRYARRRLLGLRFAACGPLRGH